MNEKFQQMLDLDQKIAEARARVEMEKSLPERGMLSPGIFDYITEGKNDLYKGYYDAVRAREMQDAQMANQRLMQEAQMANAREMQEKQLANSLRLAQESRAAQDAKIRSDQQVALQNASTRRSYAAAMLNKAKEEGDWIAIQNARKELDLANNSYNDLATSIGIQTTPFEEAAEEEYDPKKTVAYNLAAYSEVNENSTIGEIDEARNAISQFKTADAAKRIAQLDVAKKKAENMLNNKALIQKAIGEFDPVTGYVPNLLLNKKWTSDLRGGRYVLLDENGNVVTLPKKSQKKPSDDKDWN